MSSDSKPNLLIEDYRSSLQLLIHEDGRKSHLFNLFFLIQGGFFGFYYWAHKSSLTSWHSIPIVAIIVSVIWFLLILRMHAFIELRYFVLKQIETELNELHTITNELVLRKSGKINYLGGTYSIGKLSFVSVTKTESALPMLVAVFWVYIFITGIV